MKKICLVIVLVILFGLAVTPAYAGKFFDNFNDEDTIGWISAKPCTWCSLGNWRVTDGVLIEDNGRDHYKFLVGNYSLSDQSVETKILFHDNGYAGITVWYIDENNWIDVLIYPDANILRVIESEGTAQRYDYYDYPLTSISTRTIWYTMRVETNSLSGELAIYLNDVYILTHIATTSNRIGLSGLNSGNGGGSFDDFTLTSDSIVGPPIGRVQCKNSSWKTFNNPAFKNQGDCVSYLEKHQF
ncbi:MAG: hypothetical protein UT24_C0005G0037 [Candidatus Woesebacteria bacterium GW2011_GWB1_39_12]|uniref:3-keto-disaccharide hydrolase domain-containing protein n=2 Tax=Candidatus Woeseibacteriota TaxID=1752722 RepID=A0A0G0M1E3_9BACT|nr:MAG: hypothetical protein UT23_C0006G0059 [Candidatus Woesebacteria bacterium GW2011_GWA1_39_12]KKR01328.1 MAG: hypothetical protein UT24_C0005G0037 [Candidatus Woesebacteria bacterium GW2011_GWB1_39_12]